MPENRSGRQERTLITDESVDNGKTWRYPSVTPWSFYERQLVWPPVSWRTKPTEMFLNGTPRVTSSVITADTGFDYEVDTYPKRRYRNMSVLSVMRQDWATAPVLETIDDELVYNKIRSDVRGEATNLAQMMAEYSQTAKLFLDLAQAVTSRGRSLLRRVPRGAFSGKKVSGYSQAASDLYLQYTYGISPLCGDMVNAYDELKNRVQQPPFLSGVESRSKRAVKAGPLDLALGVGSARGTYDWLKTERRRYQWRAYINPNDLMNVFTSHGFSNPLAVGYELVPFSFVLDWWVNMGDVLASLDNLILLDKLVVLKSTTERSFFMCQTGGQIVTRHGAGRSLRRTDTRLQPVQISRVNSLRYKPSVSYKHIMNGVALVNSLRKAIR